MKKFFSLMLVALLLVSVLPFQAFAANHTCPKCGNANVQDHVGGAEYAATCETAGKDCLVCKACAKNEGKDYYFLVDVPATGHKTTEKVTIPATCGAAGEKKVTCANCDYTSYQSIDATGHTLDAGTVTKAATCGEEGVKTFRCTNGTCDYTKEEPIAATNAHSYNAAGVCTCGAVDGQSRTTVSFIIDNVAGVSKIYTQTYIDGKIVAVPSAELISNYEFKGWYPHPNGSGTPIVSGNTWDEDTMPNTYYAWYVYNPNKDGMSTITVTARCYIDKIGNSYLDIPVLTQALPDNTNVFDWLQNNKNTTILNSVYAKVDTTKYEWKNRYFYNHNGNEVLTEQTVFANGPKAILIKLEEKDNTTRANVQLYLHTSTTASNPFRILDMNGYTSGMNVTRDAAANLIKQYYSYKTVGNLFTESDWNALQNGESVAGRTSVYIADNGTYKIHVVVSNASSRSSSNADPRNPKTGDYITIAVGTMVMAAAAFITLAEMKKRKMI